MRRPFLLGPQPILPGARGAPLCLAVALALAVPTRARAQTDAELAAPSTEFGALPLRAWWPRLDAAPGWAVGVDGFSGVTVLATGDGSEAHGVVQGLAHVRFGYAQIAALYEHTDHNEQEWRALGGLVGAFLPHRNWVDLEFAAGLASRRLHSTDRRYGADGYTVTNVALLLRAGFSDRTTEGLFGVRLGAHLAIASDLAPSDERWRYNLGSQAFPDYVEGSTRVGGHSFALVVGGGFELASPRPPLRANP